MPLSTELTHPESPADGLAAVVALRRLARREDLIAGDSDSDIAVRRVPAPFARRNVARLKAEERVAHRAGNNSVTFLAKVSRFGGFSPKRFCLPLLEAPAQYP